MLIPLFYVLHYDPCTVICYIMCYSMLNEKLCAQKFGKDGQVININLHLFKAGR